MQSLARVLLAGGMPVALAASALAAPAGSPTALRAPAVPLVACDPYFSIWSCADRLTDETTRHWTGAPQPLTSLVRVDEDTYRLMGAEPKDVPAMPQTDLNVFPTRTVYGFQTPALRITLTFMNAALPQNLEALARPVTYLTWEARSLDGKAHAVSLYFDAGAELAVNTPDQQVVWSREKVDARSALRIGSKEQPILAKRGDNLRIDWGYLYGMPLETRGSRQTLASGRKCRSAFVEQGNLPKGDDTRLPRAASDEPPVMAFTLDLGRVGSRAVARTMLLAYDDLFGIQYFKHNLRPYWRRHGAEAAGLLTSAAREFPALREQCMQFDTELMDALVRAGGENYARICALAYRQCQAANKLVADANGQPLLFPKENFSNGCIATVDVIYPMAPQFLLLSPTLAKASLTPILDYASSPRWRWPFAPHDLGTYPQANGQVYGGGERTEENQMPVEESGNMLLLLAALAKVEGNADYCAKYWPVLTKWAEYLKEKGFDPENQLCTDDFAGHLAHNVNLSAKAILALGAYATLCEMRGDKASAEAYRALARSDAARWVAAAAEGDHYRLAFDRPNTWSQKYNLVWDRILGLNLFPPEVAAKEAAFYRRTQNRLGLPLDNRQAYTKLDWTIWTASLCPTREDFDALVGPIADFLNETPDRVPMTDWYGTKDGKKVGFQARSVVGGVFVKLLFDGTAWKNWAARDQTPLGEWAPLPVPPQVKVVVPTAQGEAARWRYTTTKPAGEWFAAGYDDAAWKEGSAGFGSPGTPGAVVRSEWRTADIWLRREVTLPEGEWKNLHLLMHHDEDAEVYVNGVLACTAAGYTTEYDLFPLTREGKAGLKPGKNVVAVHCHQTLGGQYIDLGLAEVIP